MADLERTAVGWQHVIDGCEKLTLPRSTTLVDHHGQGLLGFYRPPTISDNMQHKLALPLRGKRAQRPLPVSGLFSQQVNCQHHRDIPRTFATASFGAIN